MRYLFFILYISLLFSESSVVLGKTTFDEKLAIKRLFELVKADFLDVLKKHQVVYLDKESKALILDSAHRQASIKKYSSRTGAGVTIRHLVHRLLGGSYTTQATGDGGIKITHRNYDAFNKRLKSMLQASNNPASSSLIEEDKKKEAWVDVDEKPSGKKARYDVGEVMRLDPSQEGALAASTLETLMENPDYFK